MFKNIKSDKIVMFKNTKYIIKIVFENTNCIILCGNLAKSRFFLFLCSVKQLKQNQYEQNFEGNSSHNANDGFCGGLHKTRRASARA